MKVYTISRDKLGDLLVTVESNTAGKKRNEYRKYALPRAEANLDFEIGASSEGTRNLALSLMGDYYEGAPEEAHRKAGQFLGAFLLNHTMRPGARYELSSEVLDRWIFLLQIPQSAK